MSIQECILRWCISFKFCKSLQRKILYRFVSRTGGMAFSELIREVYQREYGIEIGYGTYGGCFNAGNIPPKVVFGNYCSIADGVKIFRANHPIINFTSHPIFYNPAMGYVDEDQLIRPRLVVGHDVWIGANAIITPGCTTIGNGAVIGAGSVVTKDVLPYSIVAGNPAKVIRLRFNRQQIAFLESTQWWHLNKDELIKVHEALQKQLNNLG